MNRDTSLLHRVIRGNLEFYVGNLHPMSLLVPMVQLDILSNEEMEDILNRNVPTFKLVLRLLIRIMQKSDIHGFEKVLMYQNIHPFVVTGFHDQLKKAQLMSTYPNTVDKVETSSSHFKKLRVFGLKLKNLIYSGEIVLFNTMAGNVHAKWENIQQQPDSKLIQQKAENIQQQPDIKLIQQTADMLFYTLDIQLENLRVHGDPNRLQIEYFDKMKRVMVYTSQPQFTAMMFLARCCSSSYDPVMDKGSMELAMARNHAELTEPCKETAIILYIEINKTLLHKYGTTDSDNVSVKDELLRKTELAINHIQKEHHLVKNNYTSMFLVKRVLIFLGLGVHGEELPMVGVSDKDLKEAKKWLEQVRQLTPEMDDRRRMFYHLAEAVLYERTGSITQALVMAREAFDIAKNNNFTTQIMAIEGHLKRIRDNSEYLKEKERTSVVKSLYEYLQLALTLE